MSLLNDAPLCRLGALLLGLGLMACQMPPEDALIASDSGRGGSPRGWDVGTNSDGESCAAYRSAAPTLDLRVSRAWEVVCGGYTQPSAVVYMLSGRGDPGQIASSGAWRHAIDQRLACEAPQAVTLPGGTAARQMSCTRRSNGAASYALVIPTPGGFAVAEGLRPTRPVIERIANGQMPEMATVARSQAVQIALSRVAAGQGQSTPTEGNFLYLMDLGRDANQTEDFAAAEEAYRQALTMRTTLSGGEDNPNLALPLMHLALNLSNQGRLGEADRLFARADRLAASSADPGAPARLKLYRGLNELNRSDSFADAARREAALTKAEDLIAQAETGFRNQLTPSLLQSQRAAGRRSPLNLNREPTAADQQLESLPGLRDTLDGTTRSALLGLSETLRYRAVIASRRGDGAQATARLAESREVLRNAGLAPGIIQGRALRTEGMVLIRNNRLSEGAQVLERAGARIAVSLPGERPVAATYFLAGRELLRVGRIDDALDAFRQGAEVLRARRSGLSVGEIIPYMDALQAKAARNPADRPALNAETFLAVQLARRSETARFLAQTSARVAAAGGNPVAAEAARRREQAESQLRIATRDRDARLASGSNVAELDESIRRLLHEREAAEDMLQSEAPSYLRLRSDAISAEAALGRLEPSEALVQIILGSDHGYALALRSGQPVQVARLGLGEATARQLVRKVRAPMDAAPSTHNIPGPYDTQAAADLYDRLLRPVEASLQGADRLVIVPDGPLLALPFGVLLTGPGDPGNLAAAPWLIHRHAIGHAPSVQALVNLRNASAPASAHPYIGFGGFVPPTPNQIRAGYPQARCNDDARLVAGLDALPGFTHEIDRAFAAMGPGAQRRMGAQFTAQAVSDSRLQDYRIVHFATHGLLPSDLSCLTEPAIVVSNPPRAPDATTGFLTASMIANLSMDTELVILSACNTAGPAGAPDTGEAAEALAGLARSFFAAGARGLLASHWVANDVVTTQMMVRILAILKGEEAGTAGITTAQALRNVQLGVMEARIPGRDLAHPYYWAAFALFGDGARAPTGRRAELNPSHMTGGRS